MQVASYYDRTIPCSEALGVNQVCGGRSRFACGYGLACVAQNINVARCRPVCGIGLDAPQLANTYLGQVASGCTVDGQSGTMNGPIDVGTVCSAPNAVEKWRAKSYASETLSLSPRCSCMQCWATSCIGAQRKLH